MSAQFDPYHKWLGIPPKDQPPNHYRLLGIELFEADGEVIEAAANRLMAYLHDLSSGDSADHAQKLLNEISAARLCLLNKDRRAAYDAGLEEPPSDSGSAPEPRAEPLPPATANSMPPPIPKPQMDSRLAALDTLADNSPTAVSQRHRTNDISPLWIGVGALALVVGLAAWAFLSGGGNEVAAPSPEPVRPATADTLPSTITGILVLELPEPMRKDAKLAINGVPRKLPASGQIELVVDRGSNRLFLARDQYQEIRDRVFIAAGERKSYAPVWLPLEQQPLENPGRTETAAKVDSPPTAPESPQLANATGTPDAAGANDTARASDSEKGRPKRGREPKNAKPRVELPAAWDLPKMGESEGLDPKTIPKTVVSTNKKIRLELAGAREVLGSRGHFQLLADAPTQAGELWWVLFVDEDSTATKIAGFGVVERKLVFGWLPKHGIEQAGALCNCVVVLSAGDQKAAMRLRTPKRFPVLALKVGTQESTFTDITLKHLPDASLLRWQILGARGSPSYRPSMAASPTTVDKPQLVLLTQKDQLFGLGVEAQLSPRRNSEELRLQHKLMYQANMDPENPEYKFLNLRQVREAAEVVNRGVLETEAYVQRLNNQQKKEIEPRLKLLRARNRYLTTIVQRAIEGRDDNKAAMARVQYRLFAQLKGHQVELAVAKFPTPAK